MKEKSEQELLKEYNKWRVEHGYPPLPSKEKRKLRQIRLSDDAWEGLHKLAVKNGHFENRGKPMYGAGVGNFLESLGRGMVEGMEIPEYDEIRAYVNFNDKKAKYE